MNTSDGAAIVDATLALAKALNLRVIAEGVEVESQVAHLASKGCDLLQGFYFARSIRPEDVPNMLQKNFFVNIQKSMEN